MEFDGPNLDLEEARAQHLAALAAHVLKYSVSYSAELMQVAENIVCGNVDSSFPLICRSCGYYIDIDTINIVSPEPRIVTRISMGRKTRHRHSRPEYAVIRCNKCEKERRLIIRERTSSTSVEFGTAKPSIPPPQPTNKLTSILSKKQFQVASRSALLSKSTNQYGLSIDDFIH